MGHTLISCLEILSSQLKMRQEIELRYINCHLQIGMADWRQVYLLQPRLVQLAPEVYKGKLVYRASGSSKRYSYEQVKKGLKKQRHTITETIPDWLSKVPLRKARR